MNTSQRFAAELDQVIGTGDVTTQPQGITMASGTTDVTPTTPTTGAITVDDLLDLMFGVAKQYRVPAFNPRFLMADARYKTHRAIATGVTGDDRLLHGMNVQAYSLLESPVSIENAGLTNTDGIFGAMTRYRLWRRRGWSRDLRVAVKRSCKRTLHCSGRVAASVEELWTQTDSLSLTPGRRLPEQTNRESHERKCHRGCVRPPESRPILPTTATDRPLTVLLSRVAEPTAMGFRDRIPEDVPAQVLGLDVNSGAGYLLEPIHRNQRIKTMIERRGFTLEPERQDFPNVEVNAWLYWLNSLVDSGKTTVVKGELPAEVNYDPPPQLGPKPKRGPARLHEIFRQHPNVAAEYTSWNEVQRQNWEALVGVSILAPGARRAGRVLLKPGGRFLRAAAGFFCQKDVMAIRQELFRQHYSVGTDRRHISRISALSWKRLFSSPRNSRRNSESTCDGIVRDDVLISPLASAFPVGLSIGSENTVTAVVRAKEFPSLQEIITSCSDVAGVQEDPPDLILLYTNKRQLSSPLSLGSLLVQMKYPYTSSSSLAGR